MSGAADRAERLRQGAAALGLALDEAAQTRLLAYLDLLAKWNRVYNLTALRDPAQMLTHHLLDSLAVVAPLSRHTQGAPGAAARRGQRRRLAGRGHRHLLPRDRRHLRGRGGQEGGLRAAGGG